MDNIFRDERRSKRSELANNRGERGDMYLA